MEETIIIRHNEAIDPVLHIWGWDVAGYLFLGGLAAGLMFFIGLMMKRLGPDEKMPRSVRWGAVLAPIFLSMGMGLLFLDLTAKLHVFRFYTYFRWTSPMSWGSWILLLVFPVMALEALVLAPEPLSRIIGGQKILARLVEITRKYWSHVATVSIGAGVSLGVYTGILLGSAVARPLWNSAALGPLFLASGVSGAAALLALMEKDHDVRVWLTRADIWALLAEVLLIVAFIIGHATGTRCHIDALGLIFGGPFTAHFWGLVVTLGIMVPLVLEWLEIKRRVAATAIVPVLVLIGGIALRYVILMAGQAAGVGGDAPLNVFF